MTLDELASLGKQMREWQKKYFSTKSGEALNASKDYERRFDAAVQEVLHPTRTLFDSVCDHAWEATAVGFKCAKCGAESDQPPRVARVTEKAPPNSDKE